jgi:hypothetical protein
VLSCPSRCLRGHWTQLGHLSRPVLSRLSRPLVGAHGEMGMSAITLIQIRFHDAERDALDNYRRQQLNPPSRAQAARELSIVH